MLYLKSAAIVFLLTLFSTFLVKRIALTLRIFDYPADGRKVHRQVVPLLGGLAIFFSFFITVGWERFFVGNLQIQLNSRQLLAMFLGAMVLMIGGFLDDKYHLPAGWQIIFPILAVFIILWGGVNLSAITNPWGGVISLENLQIAGRFILVDAIVFFWLMGMMYTTKLLDGLDGLVTGLTLIGSLMIFFLANSQKFYQPDIALLAIIFAGANLGFLIFNFHPAKIFLGEGGSLMAGFILGVLAIIVGGKIATTLLVMGIPAIDVLLVIIRRWREKKSLWQGDAGHLHYRLLTLGWSQRQVVIFLYAVAIIFGSLTLILQSKQKLIALLILAVLAVGGSVLIKYRIKRK